MLSVKTILIITLLSITSFFNTSKKLEIPPGTIQIDENFYVDKSEVANIHWLEYMYWTKEAYGEDSEQINAILPDTTNYWYNHTDYRFYPIVMISYEQARAYCKWRSDFVNARHKFKNHRKIVYRLPTIEEWNKVLQFQIDDLSFENYQKIHLKRMKELFKRNGEALSYFSVGKDTNAITLHSEKIQHLLDNVSEMTLTKGVAKGGNNLNVYPINVLLEEKLPYSRPHPYLGFRCVAEFMDK